MMSQRVFAVLCAGFSASTALADDHFGLPMESCETGAIVRDTLGSTGRIVLEAAGMCLVSYPDGGNNAAAGESNMHPPGSLTRTASMNVVSESGVILGEYRCTRAADQFEFYFALSDDGSYILQEDSGSFETPDQDSIAFTGGEFDGFSGWRFHGTMGLTHPDIDGENLCIVQ